MGAGHAAPGLPEHPRLTAAALARRGAHPPRHRGGRHAHRHHHHADGRRPGHRRHAADEAAGHRRPTTPPPACTTAWRRWAPAACCARWTCWQPAACSRSRQPAEGVNYAHKIEKAEAAIDWGQAGRRDRAAHPRLRPLPRLHRRDSQASRSRSGGLRWLPGCGAAGQVLQAGDGRLVVACGRRGAGSDRTATARRPTHRPRANSCSKPHWRKADRG